jgi:hypothetical protein
VRSVGWTDSIESESSGPIHTGHFEFRSALGHGLAISQPMTRGSFHPCVIVADSFFCSRDRDGCHLCLSEPVRSQRSVPIHFTVRCLHFTHHANNSDTAIRH